MTFRLLKFFLLIFWLSVCSSALYSQKTRKIEIYTNPFIFRGNVNNQFTNANHKYVNGEYETPYIFETGVNYVSQKEKWGWYAGLSFMMEQQVFSLNAYTPAEYYKYTPKYSLQADLDSYFLGYKVGFSYALTDKLLLNFGLTIYDQISPWNRYPEYTNDLTLGIKYFNYVHPLYNPVPEVTLFAKYNVKTFGSPYSIYLIPEFRVDYKIFENTFLTFGARVKFWTGPLDYRFEIKVDGYFDSTNPQNETFHESRVTSQGIFSDIGLKYDIPLLKKEKK